MLYWSFNSQKYGFSFTSLNPFEWRKDFIRTKHQRHRINCFNRQKNNWKLRRDSGVITLQTEIIFNQPLSLGLGPIAIVWWLQLVAAEMMATAGSEIRVCPSGEKFSYRQPEMFKWDQNCWGLREIQIKNEKKENIKIFNQWWKVSRLVFLHCAAVVSVDHGFAFESRRLLYEVFKRFGAKVS